MTGILRLADGIKAELEQLLPEQRKTQRGKLSLLVATMLDARSANLMDRRCLWTHGHALSVDRPLSGQSAGRSRQSHGAVRPTGFGTPCRRR